jgi:transposase
MWCIPPEQDAEFVWAMENVLEVYHRPYDPRRPVVCMDEKPRQLVAETRRRLSARRGCPERYDYEYRRQGTANIFLFCEPLQGRRRAQVTGRRTRQDWAKEIRRLVDEDYPEAERITLVLDNLNIHSPASLYEAFAPAEARRLVEKLEIVPTPKHGSWLNMAEIELSALEKQCLREHTPDESALRRQVETWEQDRNHREVVINWQFTTADARIRLHRLYPQIKA